MSVARLLRLRFSKRAEADLDGIFQRGLRTRSPEAAMAFVRGIRERCVVFTENPGAGVELNNTRRSRYFTFDRLVVVLYSVSEDEVLILRIFPRGRDWRALIGLRRP